jgi:putative hydrolase of HD superfamily
MTTETQDRIDSGVLSLLAHASILKRLPRTGWLLNGVTPCESVADHTTGVALLTLALAGAINADWQRAGLARPIDAGRAVMLATLHDLAESVITDLPKRSAQPKA